MPKAKLKKPGKWLKILAIIFTFLGATHIIWGDNTNTWHYKWYLTLAGLGLLITAVIFGLGYLDCRIKKIEEKMEKRENE